MSPSTNRSSRESRRLTQFRRDGLRRFSAVYLSWLALALVLCFTAYRFGGDYLEASRPALAIHIVVIAVHILYRVRSDRDNLLAPDVVFVVFYALFHLGYIFLFAVGAADYNARYIRYETAIPKTCLVANIGLVGFLFGTEVLGLLTRGQRPGRPLEPPRSAWSIAGIGLMLAGFAMHIAGIATLGFANIRTYGYTAIQDAGDYAGYASGLLLWRSSQFFAIGVVVYSIYGALRHGRLFPSRAVLLLVLSYVAILLFEGNRGPVVDIVIPLVLCQHYVIRRVRLRYLIAIVVVAVTLFTAVARIRAYSGDIQAMADEYRYQRGQLSWKTPILEMGGQFRVLNIVVHEVPAQHDYWYGDSWWSALSHTVPFLQGVLFESGWLRESPSEWLTREYFGSGAAGVGFLVSAEGYLNFGYAGAFLECMIFGLLLRALVVWFSHRPSAARALALFACLGPTIHVIRDHFNTVTHTYALVCVPAFVLDLARSRSERSGRTSRRARSRVSARSHPGRS